LIIVGALVKGAGSVGRDQQDTDLITKLKAEG